MLGEFNFGEIPFANSFNQTIFAYVDFLRIRGWRAVATSSRARWCRTVAIGDLGEIKMTANKGLYVCQLSKNQGDRLECAMNWQFNEKLQLSRRPCRELAHNMVAQAEKTWL